MGQSAARRHEEIRALQHGIELGMNLVDTAEMYDNEELEVEVQENQLTTHLDLIH